MVWLPATPHSAPATQLPTRKAPLMSQPYTLEDFRRDLTPFAQHFAEYSEQGNGCGPHDLRRALRVLEAIPRAERERRAPFLTPALSRQIAPAADVSLQEFEDLLFGHKQLAALKGDA